MSERVNVRQENPEQSNKMAKLEEPDNRIYGYLARTIADQVGEYMEVELSESSEVEAELDGVTGSGTGNYARFETPGGGITGFGVHLDLIEDVFDIEIERDEDGVVTNAPESIGVVFHESTEEDYEDAGAVDEDEAAALIGNTDESDEDEEEVVEIADEEVGLVG